MVFKKLVLWKNPGLKLKNYNSNALLYLLSFNPDKDDILMNLEEEFRPIYESAEDAMELKKKEEKDLEKKDYGKQIQNYFEEIRLKKKNHKQIFQRKLF